LVRLDVIAKIEPYLPALRLYCRSLAGTEWDTDDLVQDVIAKVLNAIMRSPERPISRPYLFRIAKNAWIDHYRAERKRRSDSTFDEDNYLNVPIIINEWLARELLEQLAESLNPRQMVLVILIDAFGFSAAESGELLGMTEGAVKEGLKRARRRLHTVAVENGLDIVGYRKHSRPTGGEMTSALFETFIAGFRKGDANMICQAYLSLAVQGVTIEKVSQGTGRYSFTLRDPNGHLIGFFKNI
jgi:RNA polymerase sigma factor (sigma-70 family)